MGWKKECLCLSDSKHISAERFSFSTKTAKKISKMFLVFCFVCLSAFWGETFRMPSMTGIGRSTSTGNRFIVNSRPWAARRVSEKRKNLMIIEKIKYRVVHTHTHAVVEISKKSRLKARKKIVALLAWPLPSECGDRERIPRDYLRDYSWTLFV